MLNVRIPLFYTLMFFLMLSCDGFKMPKNLFESSARAKYERTYKGPDSLMTKWKIQFESAASTQLTVSEDFSAVAEYKTYDLHTLAYRIDLKRGELLIIKAEHKDSLQHRFFVDVDPADTTLNASASQLLGAGKYSEIIENGGQYRIIIQPEIAFTGSFNLKIYTQPSLTFPVAGKGNSAVQSFWGAVRDGGSRNHEGVDIFAARGTRVVAAVDGIVMRTGNQGLGGKQVWLRDGILGNSLYYAHLDSVMTTPGARVSTGDTLGTVGSTGNAAGGSPHLHFGIYSTGGAVDPWPFLRKRDAAKSIKFNIPNVENAKAGSNIRTGPGTLYDISETIAERTSVKILATTGEWFHIRTASGTEGFVQKNRLE